MLAVSDKTPAQVQAEIMAAKGIKSKPAEATKAPVINLRDYFPDAPESVEAVDLAAFEQHWDECATHGRYPANRLINGKAFWVPDCPQCVQARKMAAVSGKLAAVNVPKRFHDATFDNFVCESDKQQAVLETCREYAQDFRRNLEQGNSIILYGNPGNGKNHLATAIVRQVVLDGYTALVIKAKPFLERLWSIKDFGEREQVRQGFINIDFLVLDELEKSTASKAAQDEFFALLDERYLAVKPTGIISNLRLDHIKSHIGEPAFDRLRHGDRKAVLFNWESWRGR